MCEKQIKLLCEIQAVEFTCLELQLFLDTHPDEPNALSDFNACSCRLRRLLDQYCNEFGPIVSSGLQPAGATWSWADSPWPWEM